VACLADAQTVPTPPTVTDNCSRDLSVALTTTGPDPVICSGTKAYTFTYTDCTGATFNWVYTYTISSPIYTQPAAGSSTVACLADAQTVPTPPTVTDNCSNNLAVALTTTGPDPAGCSGTKVYTFTYTDCDGVTFDWVYTYTINAPIYAQPTPGASTVACLLSAQTVPTPPTVTDNCSNNLSVALTTTGPDPAGCSGTKAYTFTYTDCDGVTFDWVYTYTISAPVYTQPAAGGSTVACLAAAQTVPTPPTVTDNCSNTLSVALTNTGADPAGCSGTKVYTFTYTDCDGVTFDWLYTYTISAPVYSQPAAGSSTVACLADAQTVPTPPTVTDNCSNTLGVALTNTGADPAGCSGTKVYTFTYTDCDGVTFDWLFTYTISAPVYTQPPAGSSTVACLADAQTVPTPPTVTDNCSKLQALTQQVVPVRRIIPSLIRIATT
jgi:hypothetical protein